MGCFRGSSSSQAATLKAPGLTLFYNPLQHEHDAMDMRTWAQAESGPTLGAHPCGPSWPRALLGLCIQA